ncbi:hypothetical protein PG994_001250 [Apiospora phragmitis]|uniref:Uncharacterized protein n=1 Tax=Apiospora phragmitis TaxID=2905665 RepID=A0ABR1WSY6_9PEZI
MPLSWAAHDAWAALSAHQKEAIDDLVAKYTHLVPFTFTRDELLTDVFSSWDSSRKPTVPTIYHQGLTGLDSLAAMKRTSPDSEDSENGRPNKVQRTANGRAPNYPSEDDKELSSASRELAASDPEALAREIVVTGHFVAKHYEKQNCVVLAFLVQKYLYNAGRIEAWSPEQDGKPQVSTSDIRAPLEPQEYVDLCVENLEEVKRAVKRKLLSGDWERHNRGR